MRNDSSLKIALQVVGLGKSTYFSRGKGYSSGTKRVPWQLDSQLESVLGALSGYELTLGYRKLVPYLWREHGIRCNHKKLYRHMKAMKLLQPRKIKPRMRPNMILERCPVQHSNQRWEADLTYVSYNGGRAYVFVIVDVYDKQIVGSCVSLRCRSNEAVLSLAEAVEKRFGHVLPSGLELVVRVDRGCQYTAKEFEDFCSIKNLRLEFCAVQTPNDKPHIESFIACYKREEVYRNQYDNFIDVMRGFYRYIQWYSIKRPHGSLGCLSPAAFRTRKNVQKDSLIAANF